MAFNPFGLGFMIPSAEEIAVAIVDEERLRRSEEELRRSEEELTRSRDVRAWRELLLDIMHRIEDYEIIKLHTHWADKNREEAQHPWYIARQKEWDERVAQGDVRVNAKL